MMMGRRVIGRSAALLVAGVCLAGWGSAVEAGEEEARPFVYPDALNLDIYVTDDRTTDGALIWSYENAGGRYTVNGVEALDGRNPNAPGAARLDTQDLDPGEEDGNPRTITLRDTVFSPIGGEVVAPPTTGIVANEVITLFASDGSLYTSKEMFIYTDHGGEDRLSGLPDPPPPPPPIPHQDQWMSASQVHSGGGTVGMTNTEGEGLCIEVPGPGTQEGYWISPYGYIDLSAMTVWRIRVVVNAGDLPAGTTPLWGLVVDNYSTDPPVIDNKYGSEYFVLDNVGGANNANGPTQYDFYFTPLPVLADDWNDPTSGMFTAQMDARNNARVIFRVLDVANIGYGGELDAGRVCLERIELTSINFNELEVDENEYAVTELSAETHTVDDLDGAGNTDIFYLGGNVTIRPVGNWGSELITFTPGNRDPGYPGDLAEAEDNYPVVDTEDGLYRIQMGARAPNAAAELAPPDGIRLGADDSTNEVLMTANVLATVNPIGMPKAAGVTTYTTFYASGRLSADTTAGARRIRPRADILSSETVGYPNPVINVNGVTLTSMSMDRMVAP